MKKVLTLISLSLTLTYFSANAQTKTNSKLGVQSKLSAKDSMMCKEWKAITVEEWAVKSTLKEGDKSFNDMLKLSPDGKFEAVLLGNKKSGTWTKSGQNLFFTDEATKTKFSYKVISSDQNMLKVDHYSDEEGHSLFEMVPKK
ncbi:MAG: hypothetical protein M3R27_09985 [Bacteroidota bacterium]|nr:hypothetical protein [Bacteroidota bacterium]